MSAPLIELEGVSKSFGGVKAVQNVTLQIPEGGIIGLVGPNGAGKSTLFDLITGVQRLDSGTRRASGKDLTTAPSHVFASLGMARTFQKVRLFDSMTVIENVIVGALLNHSRVDEARASGMKALARLGLEDRAENMPTELTLIDRKRLEMARALVANPKVLLLDEVMTGLTPQEIEDAVQLILSLARSGITVVLVEHLLKVVMRICDRVLVLEQGKLIADGTPAEVQNNQAVIEAYIGIKHEEEE